MEESKPDLLTRLAKARGDEIRRAREAKGWSQSQLADAAQTKQQTVDRVERGVTSRSKAIPSLRKALGLSVHEGLSDGPPLAEPGMIPELDEYIDDMNRALSVSEGTHLPVYAMTEAGILLSDKFADAIPRPYPVQNVKNAYGIICRDYRMEPVVRPGDIVVVNPNIPPAPQTEAVFSKRIDGVFRVLIRSLIKENEASWSVSTALSDADVLQKEDWPTAELIVAKISRVR